MRQTPAWMLCCSLASTAAAQVGTQPGPASSSQGAAPAEPAGSGFRLTLPPVLWSGSVGIDLRRDQDDTGLVRQQRQVTSTLSAATYLYAPWLARLNGTLGLTTGSAQTTGFDFSGSDTRYATGKLVLSVFPQSRFPAELRYEVSDSRTDTSLGGGVDYRTRNFALLQRYRPADNAFAVNASYERRSQDSEDFGRESQESLFADFSSNWKRQQLAASLSRNTNRRAATDEETDMLSLTARHSMNWGPSLSLESSANWVRTDDRLSSGGNALTVAQASSLAIWRSETAPLILTGSLRALSFQGSGSGAAESLSAGLGVSYEFNRNVRLNGSVTASRFNRQNTVNTTGALSGTYQGDQRQWAGIQWAWYSGVSLSAQRAASGLDSSVSTQLGHSASRSWQVGRSTFSASLGQSGSATYNNRPGTFDDPALNDRLARALTHTASVAWSHPGQQGMTFARLTIADARQLSGEQAHFQQANFQVSGHHEIDRRRSWSGNLTLQGTSQSSRRVVQFNASDTARPVDQTSYGASGEVAWIHNRMFDVPRLNFSSRLRMSLDTQRQVGELIPLPDRELASWENRLDYRVGRLESSLSLRVARVEGRQQVFVMWRLQRSFGG